MVLALAFLLGFALGWHRAGGRGGARLDQLQWGAAYGILFSVIALVGLVIVEHLTVA